MLDRGYPSPSPRIFFARWPVGLIPPPFIMQPSLVFALASYVVVSQARHAVDSSYFKRLSYSSSILWNAVIYCRITLVCFQNLSKDQSATHKEVVVQIQRLIKVKPKRRWIRLWLPRRRNLLDRSFSVSGLGQVSHWVKRLEYSRHTLSDIPSEMPDPIEGVESERRRQDGLGGVLDCLRKSGNSLQHMHRVESSRSGEVCQEVAIHHYSM